MDRILQIWVFLKQSQHQFLLFTLVKSLPDEYINENTLVSNDFGNDV